MTIPTATQARPLLRAVAGVAACPTRIKTKAKKAEADAKAEAKAEADAKAEAKASASVDQFLICKTPNPSDKHHACAEHSKRTCAGDRVIARARDFQGQMLVAS